MGCNEKRTKKELIRIVKQKDGNVEVDKTGKMEGRGNTSYFRHFRLPAQRVSQASSLFCSLGWVRDPFQAHLSYAHPCRQKQTGVY